MTYGINFPFRRSTKGDYVSLSIDPEEEIRSDLIHLILTRKGTRYFLPDFGTRIYEFIFEIMDGTTFDLIKEDIRTAVNTYLPNVLINEISITPFNETNQTEGEINEEELGHNIFKIPGEGTQDYTKIKNRLYYSR